MRQDKTRTFLCVFEKRSPGLDRDIRTKYQITFAAYDRSTIREGRAILETNPYNESSSDDIVLDYPLARLGILVGRRSVRNRPYHEQTTFFRRLIREGSGIGVSVFVFSPPGIHWSSRRITGWTWSRKRWIRKTYPFPHAIYDRVSPKQRADLHAISGVRRGFLRRGIPLFNTKIGDKWHVHRRFFKDERLKPFLPPTKTLTHSNLTEFMHTYGEVYIKPAKGGQGNGVCWAKKTRTGYVYRIQRKRGSRSGRVNTIGALAARSRSRGRLMIVQKAIPMLEYENRTFDVRVLAQRGMDGEWRLTGIVARLGAPNKKVTNIHQGGKACRLDDVLKGTGADEKLTGEVVEQVESVAMDVIDNVAQSTRYVGELGIDLAIDKSYNVWFLEANSRTGRISLHRAGLDSAPLGDRAPAEYALYLSGRGRNNT